MKKRINGKKGFGILSGALLLTCLLAACGKEAETEGKRSRDAGRASGSVSSRTPTPTEPVHIEDELTISSEEGKEFYIMRVGAYDLEIPGACEYLLPEGLCPDLEDGKILKVVADVDIYDGGIAGYCGNLCIRKLISATSVDFEDALTQLPIPDAATTPLNYENRILQYTIAGQSYLFTMDGADIAVYTEDGRYMEYPRDAQKDILQPFFEEWIFRLHGENAQILPDLDEDGIKNLTDVEYHYYGKLSAEGLLVDAVEPNPLRKEFGLESDEVAYLVGLSASRSAADKAEAMAVAEEEWQPLGDNTFEDPQLIGESPEFYLFSCDHYYKGKFNRIDTLLVYKQDYYDAETKTCVFELNEENLRRFVAYGTPEYDSDENVFGEFVTEEADALTLRRYIIETFFADGHDRETVHLRIQEWKVSKADGKLEYNEEYIR